MKKLRISIIVLLIAAAAVSCKKFVDVDAPIDSITTATAYATDAKTDAVVRGLYMSMVKSTNNSFGGAMSAGAGVCADELKVTSTTSAYEEFYINTISGANTPVGSYYWAPMYSSIYTANAIIENVPGSAGMSAAGKKQYMAEAKFIRAANYLYLVNLYGAVPLVTSTDYTANAQLSRSSADEVYKLIQEDLTAAHDNLDVNYTGTVRIRANRYAASALLARVYLYLQDWKNAEAMATEVITGVNTSGTLLYGLEPALNNVFLLGSKESILHIEQPATNQYTWDGYLFVPSVSTNAPSFQLTDTLYHAFQTGDLRKTSWVKTYTLTSGTYNAPYKYKLSAGTGTKSESLEFLRLGEVYLIRAEARAQQNETDLAVADLDLIRARAGLTTPTPATTSSTDLLTLIARERFLELFAELGHRWFDLKRTNMANTVLAGKPDWSSDMQLWPIPKTETSTDINLTQNPGYAN